MARMPDEPSDVPPPGDGPTGPKPMRPCPICGKPAEPDTRPFCSKRCADVDLHRWLGGSYAIPIAEGMGGIEDADDVF